MTDRQTQRIRLDLNNPVFQQQLFALERQDAVDDDLEDEGLNQPDQPQANGEEHQLPVKRRELPQRLAKPGKRYLAAVVFVLLTHRQLTASAGEVITQAPGRADASGETAKTIIVSALGKADAARA